MGNTDAEIKQLCTMIEDLGYNLNITWNHFSCRIVLNKKEALSTTGNNSRAMLYTWLCGFLQGVNIS